MSTQFIGLYDKDAVKSNTLGMANATTAWKWTLPTNLNSRQCPTAKLSVASCYLDDSYTTAAGTQNCSKPRMLRMKVYAENYLQNETSSTIIGKPIVAIMTRDAFVGHWYAPQAPHQIDLDFSTNIRQIEFDFVDLDGAPISTLSAVAVGGKLCMVLKLEYPEHNELRNNVVMSYPESVVGMPRYNKL